MRIRFLCLLLIFNLPVKADVAIETYGGTSLDEFSQHTLAINTFGESILVYDADTDSVLGMLTVGIGVNALEIDHGKNVAYAAETYLSRHTRGERTDVVTKYDLNTLAAVSEIEIPPKHASGAHMRHYSGIVRNNEGGALMLVTNITPAVSISIVDLNAGKFLNEINTAGCGLVYPVDDLGFLQLCGDGTAQLIRLDAAGNERARIRSDVFFDLQKDPLMEKPAKTPDGWVFNTFAGDVFRVSASGNRIVTQKLFSIAHDDEAWRVGGMQPLAYHQGQNVLLALMHEGGEDSHKDPGTEVWYYDLESVHLMHRMTLENPAISVQVSQDDAPLIYTSSIISGSVDIYDMKTAKATNSFETSFPTILQNLK